MKFGRWSRREDGDRSRVMNDVLPWYRFRILSENNHFIGWVHHRTLAEAELVVERAFPEGVAVKVEYHAEDQG